MPIGDPPVVEVAGACGFGSGTTGVFGLFSFVFEVLALADFFLSLDALLATGFSFASISVIYPDLLMRWVAVSIMNSMPSISGRTDRKS